MFSTGVHGAFLFCMQGETQGRSSKRTDSYAMGLTLLQLLNGAERPTHLVGAFVICFLSSFLFVCCCLSLLVFYTPAW